MDNDNFEQESADTDSNISDEDLSSAQDLHAEIEVLQRKLVDAPKRIRTLEEKLIDIKAQLSDTSRRNERLSATLREAREHEDDTVDIFTAGRKMRVSIHPEIETEGIKRGDEVVLNDSLNVIEVRSGDKQGELVMLREVLEDGKRALVMGRGDEERVCELADYLIGTKLRVGAYLLLDQRSGLLIEQITRPEVEQLVLEEVPDIGYEDIGGLDSQIEMIHDAVELPYMYGDIFKEHELEAPKGILLYGPPGCGKTLIAKAVANSLAKRVAEKTGEAKKTSYFLNVKGFTKEFIS